VIRDGNYQQNNTPKRRQLTTTEFYRVFWQSPTSRKHVAS